MFLTFPFLVWQFYQQVEDSYPVSYPIMQADYCLIQHLAQDHADHHTEWGVPTAYLTAVIISWTVFWQQSCTCKYQKTIEKHALMLWMFRPIMLCNCTNKEASQSKQKFHNHIMLPAFILWVRYHKPLACHDWNTALKWELYIHKHDSKVSERLYRGLWIICTPCMYGIYTFHRTRKPGYLGR